MQRENFQNKYSGHIQNIRDFFILYFKSSSIHGVTYFSFRYLHLIEKLFWLMLVSVAFCVTVLLSLQSLNRYKTKNTVISIEKDYYYWNVTLPSLTICPLANRIDQDLFDEYCKENYIKGQDKVEFYEFIESMANATYENFHQIKDYISIKKLNIKPKDYMMLIFNLTLDQLRTIQYKSVRTFHNLEYIQSEQILTEHGICYITNHFLASNLSAKYLLTGMNPKPLQSLDFYQVSKFHDILTSNVFDGDKSYSMVGFSTYVLISIHSPYEVMNIARAKYSSEHSFEFICSSNEMVADKNFQRDTSVTQRQCRFKSESNLTHYPIYTQGLCMQECRLELVYKLCGCIPHFYPNRISKPKPICSYEVLKNCVAPKRKMLLELQMIKNGRTAALDCNCLQNCVGSNVHTINYKILKDTNKLLGTIGGILIYKEHPIIRYKRKILFSLTDFWVSVGGTVSFFTGVCVLGVIEIIYFFTIRLFWHICGKRIEPIETDTRIHQYQSEEQFDNKFINIEETHERHDVRSGPSGQPPLSAYSQF